MAKRNYLDKVSSNDGRIDEHQHFFDLQNSLSKYPDNFQDTSKSKPKSPSMKNESVVMQNPLKSSIMRVNWRRTKFAILWIKSSERNFPENEEPEHEDEHRIYISHPEN